MTPLEFDWDDANTGHIARHDVTTGEAEQIVTGQHGGRRFQTRSGEVRRSIIGQTPTGRVLRVVYILRGGRVRVVTAHMAKAKERRQFEGGK
jgi:uncharacterized DUF497 family protein